jgi:RHS repeat-associated protein
MESVKDASGTIEYAFDDLNLPSAVTRFDAAMTFANRIEYGYDYNDNLTSLTVDNGTTVESTAYTFDALNRLDTVTDPDSNITTYTYDNVGNRETVTYPNNTQASYLYDSLNRLTYLENRDLTLNSVISSYTYDLGAAGNRLAVTEHTGRRVDYAYDDIYRLVEERIFDDGVTLADDITYTYDDVSNRLTKTDNGGTIAYSYDANDRLLSAGGTSFTYDSIGNTLSKTDPNGTVSYAYDYENRLAEINDPTVGLTTYAYDPRGNRVSKTDTVGITSYLVDTNRRNAQVLQETAPDGSLTSYVYGDDLISQNRSGSLSFYHYDGNMSTRQLTNAGSTIAITDTYTYDAFGNVLTSTGSTPNNYLYTGEQYSPNAGFYYLRARYYDPEIGRFLNRDTYVGSPFEPQSLHKYAYAHSDPINRIDPSGHRALNLMEMTIVMGIITFLWSIHITTVAQKRIAHQFFNRAASRKRPRPDGVILSLGGGVSTKRGLVFSGDVIMYWDLESMTLHGMASIDAGFAPLALFKDHRGKSSLVTIGAGFGASSPSDFSGVGYTATWPISMVDVVLPKKLTSVWGWLTQLAKYNKKGGRFRRKWGVIQFGYSRGNEAAFVAYGKYVNAFSATVGLTTRAVNLFDIPEWAKELLEEASDTRDNIYTDSIYEV